MDIKLAILFFIISAIIALSYLEDGTMLRVRDYALRLRRREYGLRRAKL